MSNLLSGLEGLGLGDLSGMDIYAKNKTASKKSDVQKKSPIIQLSETDFVYDKNFQCPVCARTFKAKVVKAGKVKLEGVDTDLRPIYKDVDPLKYDAIVCTHCGYAALSRYFNFMTRTYANIIKESISSNFENKFKDTVIYSYDDAIVRHKLALLNAVVKRAKDSEKAYTCLKIAWLLRGKRAHINPEMEKSNELISQLLEEEEEFILKAYEGFTSAYTSEVFPMCGLDEPTCLYINADLARQLKKYEDAMMLVSRVILSKSSNERIKDKARALKDEIRFLMDERDGHIE